MPVERCERRVFPVRVVRRTRCSRHATKMLFIPRHECDKLSVKTMFPWSEFSTKLVCKQHAEIAKRTAPDCVVEDIES